jgi:hypothetical protein
MSPTVPQEHVQYNNHHTSIQVSLQVGFEEGQILEDA